MSASRLFVGIGSPHGDDRVGWEIARRLSRRKSSSLVVRSACTPAELLDWLEEIDILDICDAVASNEPGSLLCWSWPAAEIERAPFRGTHDMTLQAALMLAAELKRLPRCTRIWGVGIKPPISGDALSPEVAAAIPNVVDRLCEALHHA